uniref:Uncharacterized protein n=1 Tax=Terrapene triunguis TaxID=2587831 RepID=A0A674I848_9SAUR
LHPNLLEQGAMAEKQAQLQQYLEQSNNEIMQLNNQLALLQAQQEQARAKVHQWVSGETVALQHARGRGVGDCQEAPLAL